MIQDESKILNNAFNVCRGLLALLLVGATLFGASRSYGAKVQGSIQKVGDSTHIEFQGLAEWNYELKKKNGNTLELIVPPFDGATEAVFQSWAGPFIKSVLVDKKAPDGRYRVFLELTGAQVESFDYLTDEPSRLIVDLFKQIPEPSEALKAAVAEKVANAKKKFESNPAKVVQKVGDYTKYNRGKRKPASELYIKSDSPKNMVKGRLNKGVYDGGDPNFDRFRMKDYQIKEEAIIASRHNIYIHFPVLKMPTSELSQYLANRPEYVIREKDTKENKEARLLVNLYNKGRRNLFLKTFYYFIEKYPDSKYDEIVRHMAAEIYFDRYREEGKRQDFYQAKKIYLQLISKYPKSPLVERTEMLLAYEALESGDGAGTIQQFQKILSKYKGYNADQAKKAIAEGFMVLNKYDDALKTYEDLTKTANNNRQGIEAFYRIGDVYIKNGNYEKAVESYQAAIKAHPEYENTFPNAHYNMAEGYFWMGKYKEALNHYIEFLSRFPSHPHGGYALTRIGEHLEILGADQKDVMGAFLEAYFRYRTNPGARIARVRMLSQRMKGMKEKEFKKALDEINQIAEESPLPRVKEFVTLMVADGLERRKEHSKAMDLLIGYYQQNPTSTDLNFFKKKILGSIASELDQYIEKEDFIEALRFHGKFKNTWLRGSDRLDIPYFIGKGYEQAGVYKEAEKIYDETYKAIQAIRGTRKLREKKVTEKLPSLEELHLRKAKVFERSRKYAEAQKEIRKIKNMQNLSEKSRVELTEVAAIVEEQRGNIEKAKSYLAELEESWEGNPELLTGVLLRLASLQMKSQELVDAGLSIEKLENIRTDGGEVEERQWIEGQKLKGEILEKQGKSLAAVETYSKLLNSYEAKVPLASVRYKTGRLLYEKGDIRGAEGIWSKLDPEKDKLFSQLATERLKDAEWKGTYDKYIQRIPAMSGKQN